MGFRLLRFRAFEFCFGVRGFSGSGSRVDPKPPPPRPDTALEYVDGGSYGERSAADGCADQGRNASF